MKGINIYIYVCLVSLLQSFVLIGQAEEVENILSKSREAFYNNTDLSCELQYSLYPTYTEKNPSEEFTGKMVKHLNNHGTKINETLFITDTDSNIFLKLNKNEKAMQVVEDGSLTDQSPLDLLNIFIKQFKNKTIIDNGSNWICTLTTDKITQLPFGKVEIYIDKQTYLMSKQVLYLLARVPYTDNQGNQSYGNPKLEITISDFRTKITREEKDFTRITTYIRKNNNTIHPIGDYKDFQIIQN